MRSLSLSLVGLLLAVVLGCGQREAETPQGAGDSLVAVQPVPDEKQPFEQAFRVGQIEWEPVKNVEVTTKTAEGSSIQSSDFQVKFKYDENGIRSLDTTGYQTYEWTGKQATFGPGAVVRITNMFNVLEGELKAGDQWVWDGANWISKTVVDERLANSELPVIDQLGGLPVSLVVRDPGAAVDPTLDNLYVKLNEKPGDVQEKIKECLAESKCLPAVVILKLPQDCGDVEKRLGQYQEKLDQSMLFPIEGEGEGFQAKPVHWYRYGRLDVGVDFLSPVIVAVRIRSADF